MSSATMSADDPVIDIRHLSVSYRSGRDAVQAVRSVSFAVARGETVAIVGESGSGKSTVAHAIIGLLPVHAHIGEGQILVGGEDVVRASESTRRHLRGKVIGLVPQDPQVSLNPTTRIGRQIGEALVQARGHRHAGLDADIIELLEQVGIDQPVLRARQYPHELSGGMKQRVLIAMALAGDPALIIADEPTSALDVTVQRRILDHLERLASERNISLLIITHDLGVASDRADRILVMKEGRIVEHGSPHAILVAPREDYTRALIAAAPALGGHGQLRLRHEDTPAGTEILRLESISKRFQLRHGDGHARSFLALDDVSLSAHAGQTLAIVGESGSGKTTALRIALGLEQATSGRVIFEGQDIGALSWNEFRPLRRRIQLVQQNPFASLDPRFTVFESIVEPLVSFGLQKGRALESSARRLIDLVQLPAAFLTRLPRELSGGQRQRVAIARALALEPELLFLDEPVSALDVSVQAQILALLGELQERLGVSYVLVSHDLSVVASVAHRVVVLRNGKIVEQGPIARVFGQPVHEYTQELLAAVPGRELALAA